MAAYFNLNNNEIWEEFLVNKFNMVLDNQGRLVLNDQKSPFVTQWTTEISWVCSEAAIAGVLLKKGFLKISQISQENTCVGASFRPATLLKRDINTGIFP